ncbi:Dynein heavy chain, partial [Aduncisulcus paluster]
LRVAEEDLASKEAALAKLQAKYDNAMAEKQALEDEAIKTRKKLTAARALISGLSGERERWEEESQELKMKIGRLIGDVSLCSAFLSYAGAFNQEFRNILTENWLKDMRERVIPFTPGIQDKITQFLVSEATVGEWNLQGLPTDDLSVQNGIIVTTATRYPLLIDPQAQANTWIKNREGDNNLKVTKLNHRYFKNHLEDALNNGFPILIEDVEDELDPMLDPILEKQFVRSGKSLKVRLGDEECDVTDGFMLYITTRIANPKYSPEVFAKAAIIDFAVTMNGLEQQLLTRVVNKERVELEEQRHALLETVNKNKKQLEQLEEDLLFRLSTSKKGLLDDDTLVEVLAKTKSTTAEVKEKLASASEMEAKINEAREEYRPVATRGSIMYFLVAEMALVNNNYQTSLKQFLAWFDLAIETAEASP